MNDYLPEATHMFVEAGRTLWGDDWHAKAAKALDLNIRTVQRFEVASQEGRRLVLPRRGVMEDLRDLLDEKGSACIALRDKFDRAYQFLPSAEMFGH